MKSHSLEEVSAIQDLVDIKRASGRDRRQLFIDDAQLGELIKEIFEESARVESMELATADFVHRINRAGVSPKAIMNSAERDT